jgi:hypothetical protein
VDAVADWRVITIANDAYGWKRVRQHTTLDWRKDDPAGEQFVAWPIPQEVATAACQMQFALGLTFSVQDWLEADTWRFLEVNPQGQWLFLRGSDDIVGSAMARHLAGGLRPTDGR